MCSYFTFVTFKHNQSKGSARRLMQLQVEAAYVAEALEHHRLALGIPRQLPVHAHRTDNAFVNENAERTSEARSNEGGRGREIGFPRGRGERQFKRNSTAGAG